MEKSRTEHSMQNIIVAICARMLAILSGFFVRVIFTHTLSQEYVGINGLFSDIISVLALSELGIGTAITFTLYKPIAEKDVEKQKSIMKLYQRFYYMVAGIVLVAGLSIIPFMNILVKDHEKIDHLILIYLMYLFSSVSSYFMIYKKTLIDAHQLSYIGVLYHTIWLLLQYVCQAVILLVTKNFILYLSVLIFCTLANNYMISRKADRLYPFLNDKNVQNLSKEEKSGIFTHIRAMLMHKVGNVLVNNTDNLLLSSIVGTISVGCYSNYYLVIGSVRQVLEQCFQGIAASVGNLGATENKERVKKVFLCTFFLGQWIYGMVTIAMFEVLNSFIGKSFGQTYVFDRTITLILCVNFYLLGMRQATLVFRDSLGLFHYDRYKSIVEAIINLAVSILLGQLWGVVGIFLGTLISMVTTSLWVEPYMLYKHKLKESGWDYCYRFLFYSVVTGVLWLLEDRICARIVSDSWGGMIIRAFLCLLITNLVYFLLYHRTFEFQFLMTKAGKILRKKLENKGKIRSDFSEEEEAVLTRLKEALTESRESGEGLPASLDYRKIQNLIGAHRIGAFFYRENMDYPVEMQRQITTDATQTVLQNYRLLMLDKYLYGAFRKEKIDVVFLKGVTTGNFYPTPELRKTGDVDMLLLDKGQSDKAANVLKGLGFAVKKDQDALHHIVFEAGEGIDIELHLQLAEPFDNREMNDFLQEVQEKCHENVVKEDILGVELPVLSDGYHAYELLLHMLQHFLRSGFGIKLLCDWVVFWNRPVDEKEKEKFMNLVNASRIKGFSDMITLVCCDYLGLRREQVEWMNLPEYNTRHFLREVLDAEEFGKSSRNRMVALRGDTMVDYWREFHHQMHLNFPRAGKWVLLWPVLWGITFVRFVNNNKKIRKISFWAIMENAGQRGRILKDIHLFKG